MNNKSAQDRATELHAHGPRFPLHGCVGGTQAAHEPARRLAPAAVAGRGGPELRSNGTTRGRTSRGKSRCKKKTSLEDLDEVLKTFKEGLVGARLHQPSGYFAALQGRKGAAPNQLGATTIGLVSHCESSRLCVGEGLVS